MEIARVTSKGQITIPKRIRDALGLKEGSQVVFLKKDDEIVVKSPVMLALEELQEAFKGEAERLGLKTEEDVVNMIKEFRKEKRAKKNNKK